MRALGALAASFALSCGGSADGTGGGGGRGGSSGAGVDDVCQFANRHVDECGASSRGLVCPRGECEAMCIAEATCDTLAGRDAAGDAKLAMCINFLCTGATSSAGPATTGVGAGAGSGAGGSTPPSPTSSGAGGSEPSTGAGGGHLSGCIAYVNNMCAVCNALCSGSARENALDDCDTFYAACQTNLDCQAHASTCQAAGQCPDC